MVAAVFPAAGRGKRMGCGSNKVFLELMGIPILLRSLRVFSKIEEIGHLVVIVGKDEVKLTARFLKHVPDLKPWTIVEGGAERQYSIANGLRALPAAADLVLVHDAARPLVLRATIEGVIAKAREMGGAIAAVPSKNTIKVVGADGIVRETPDRENLWVIQTPQGFHRDLLERAYAKAEEDGFLGTDDASLIERLGAPVAVVKGTYENIKITTPEDLALAEAILREEAGGMENLLRKAKAHITARFK